MSMWDRPPNPYHDECNCVSCVDWWAALIVPGIFATPRPIREHKPAGLATPFGRSCATTWDVLRGRFVWEEMIPLGTLITVLGVLQKPQPGYHTNAALVSWVKDGNLVIKATFRGYLMPASE